MASGKFKTRYGRDWDAQTPDWVIELAAFKSCAAEGVNRINPGAIPDVGDPRDHFIRASNMFWGHKKAATKFIWHPWAEDMLDACISRRYVGFAGAGSSGKSQFLGVWGLLNWLAASKNTLVLLTSTTIRDARKRVWGAVQDYYSTIQAVSSSKLVTAPTPAIIPYRNGAPVDRAGLHLIPAEAKKTSEVTGKMRGMKQSFVYLIADELSELGHALLDTALNNLSNNDHFCMSAAANPNSYYDPFSRFVKPKGGWESITVDDAEWEMENGGLCLHFDALKNPNYIGKENKWPIQKWEKVVDALKYIDVTSPGFWRDYRGFWCPTGTQATIYSESDFIKAKADQAAIWKDNTNKIRVAGFDPAFSSGGDRAVLKLGWFGADSEGNDVVEFSKHIEIHEDVTKKNTPRAYQITRKLITILNKENVRPWHFGLDATSGSGSTLSDVIANEWGTNDFLRVSFAGAASERPVSVLDPTPSKDKYTNRVTELWFYGVELLRSGQLRGVDSDMAREMTLRQHTTSKGLTSKVTVEPKKDMKARTGKSPDIADASFVLLEVVRARLGLQSTYAQEIRTDVNKNWNKAVKRFTSVHSRSIHLQGGRRSRRILTLR